MMEKNEIKRIMKEIKALYPSVKKIDITFSGYGDSFDGFDEYTGSDDNDITIEIKQSDFEKLDVVCDHLIDKLGLSFDNEGCQGSVKFNFEEWSVDINSEYNYLETFSGDSMTLELDIPD